MAAVHGAGNGTDAALARQAGENEYDRHSMLGTLVGDDDDEDVPLLYFHSIPEAWRWFMSWMIPGMGMFCEAYFIFSIGNIKPFFTYQYPNCFGAHLDGCSKNLTRGPDYSQILGIICGMVTLGFIGDKIGRKWGSVTTVVLMLVGAIFLTANGASLSGRGFTIMYIVSQFLFGYGVGGEYPMAAGSAAERAEAGGKKKAAKRGQEVVLTFSMQGVGNFVNTAVLLVCFPIYSTIAPSYRTTNPTTGKVTSHYSFERLNGVWRTSFGLGMLPLLFMLYYRIFRLKESAVWKATIQNKVRGRGGEFAAMCFHFWHRLLATGGTWFLWDFSFYGNKVFQSSFIEILSPGASLFTTLLWTLLNSGCALVGYYVAAFTVDCRYLGRLRIQIFGFLMVAILFYASAIWFHPLITPGGIHVFQFIYFFSSFWGQFGPNCTTFLLAGELYPTALRTSAHGFSAGVAKVGALWAAVWFNYLDPRTKFWLTASFNIGGCIMTLLFMPDPLRVSLAEVDRRWSYITSGRVYHGEAIAPRNLSMFERLIGTGKNYDKSKDEEDRWQESMDLAGAGPQGHKAGYEPTKNGTTV